MVFQGLHERALILALQSWLTKVAPSQSGLVLVELYGGGFSVPGLVNSYLVKQAPGFQSL